MHKMDEHLFMCTYCNCNFKDEVDRDTHTLFVHGILMPTCSVKATDTTRMYDQMRSDYQYYLRRMRDTEKKHVRVSDQIRDLEIRFGVVKKYSNGVLLSRVLERAPPTVDDRYARLLRSQNKLKDSLVKRNAAFSEIWFACKQEGLVTW